MITGSTVSFIRALKANNTREWFEDHKHEYHHAYGEVIGFTAELLSVVSSIGESALDPKNCIMRICRDVRFSRDKSPCKTGFFCVH
jgi:uncharacterized protein (TIGR02453 family)